MINIKILHKIVFPVFTLFFIIVNFVLFKYLFEEGLDEMIFWLIPTIILLLFFGYYSFKLFTEEKFLITWERTYKSTTKGLIVSLLIIGIISLISTIHLSSYSGGNTPEGIDFIYAILISFLSLLLGLIVLVQVIISFYKDFKKK